ncbi:MAG: choice-of-anchor D domain-containing protein [Anaerolineae bacterium]|nr:choice-of-anchor D domain-containing protein [Anaerolineae bacterium]
MSDTTTTFKLQYAPTAAGVHTATVAIENNDSDENPYTFVVSGRELSSCPPGSYINKTTGDGLGSDNVYGVYAEGSTVYAATRGGLSISTDGGSSFSNKTTSDGLGANNVRKVYAEGSTVYAATSSGLSISTNDGSSFSNKTISNGMGSNSVNGVYAEGSTIYVATDGGLSISTDGGNSFSNKTTSDGLGANYVNGVYADGSTVYAATYGGGLSISTDGGSSFITKTTTHGLGDNYVNGVYAEGSTVYAATDGGLSISTNGGSSFTTKTTSDGLGDNFVLGGVYVEGSTVYAATDGGLSISTDGGNSFSNKTTSDGLGSKQIYGVQAEGSTLYVATLGGLSLGKCISPHEIDVQGNGASIANGDTTPSLADHTDFGAVAVNSSLTRTFTVSNSGGEDLTLTGSPLVTVTNTSGFFSLTQPPASPVTADSTTTFKIKYAPTAAGVHTATVAIENNDSDENPYTFVVSGQEPTACQLYPPASFTNRTTADGLDDDAISGVYAKGSTVYAATYNGGLSISTDGGSSFSNKTTADGLGSNNVNGVYVEGSTIYVATDGGLSISTNGGSSFSTKTTSDGLGSNFVYGVYAEGSTIYAATNGGLSISTNGGSSFSTKTTADGLGDNYVNGVYVEGSTVYAATFGGLSLGTCTSDSLQYFPMLMKGFEPLPDLIITDLQATSTAVTVTIVNTGTASVVDAFWIDVYFDLDAPPTVNQPWPTTDASHGVVWGLFGSDLPILPGESRTLILADATQFFGGEQVTSDPPYPVGVDVYGYVDSVKVGFSFAAVTESDESNNVFGPVTSGTGGATSLSKPPEGSQSGEVMPQR